MIYWLLGGGLLFWCGQGGHHAHLICCLYLHLVAFHQTLYDSTLLSRGDKVLLLSCSVLLTARSCWEQYMYILWLCIQGVSSLLLWQAKITCLRGDKLSTRYYSCAHYYFIICCTYAILVYRVSFFANQSKGNASGHMSLCRLIPPRLRACTICRRRFLTEIWRDDKPK